MRKGFFHLLLSIYQQVNNPYFLNRYAGWLGSVAARYEENGKLSGVVPSLEEGSHRLAVIAGTSTCHLVQVHIFFPSPQRQLSLILICDVVESPRYLR